MQCIRPQQYKANLHCHSNLSDGSLTPQELKEAYKAHGYSILAITDHERPHDHTGMSEADFLMLTGYEVYIRPNEECRYDAFQPELHINLFAKDPHNIDSICFNERYVKYVKDPAEKAAMHKYGSQAPRQYTQDYINAFIRTAKEDGYIVSLNHPEWSLEEDEILYGFEGFFSMELCNYGVFVSGLHEYNGALYDKMLRRGKRLFAHSADDNHDKVPLGKPGNDSFGGFAMICADTLTYEAVIEALEKGDFYSSMGPEIYSMEIRDNKVHVECSEAVCIALLYGGKETRHVYPEAEGQFVTEADFEIPARAEYVRVSVIDEKGRIADTRGYFRDEWEEK